MGGILKSTWEMLHDGRFLKKALMIACPVALQGMLNTIVNMVDTLMIGGLGSTAIAAVGLANKVFFVFSLLVFGIVSGGGILAAQFWGSGDVKKYQEGFRTLCDACYGGSHVFCGPGPYGSQNGHEDLYHQ